MTLFDAFCSNGFQRGQSFLAPEFCWFKLHSVEVDQEVSETVPAFYKFSIEGDCWHCLFYCFVVEDAPQGGATENSMDKNSKGQRKLESGGRVLPAVQGQYLEKPRTENTSSASVSTRPIKPGTCQRTHKNTSFEVTGMT